jgi:hypothetical protein
MYHHMHLDLSLIRERNERMRAEMSRLSLEKRLRNRHERSGPRLLASYLLRLTRTFRPLRGTGAAER